MKLLSHGGVLPSLMETPCPSFGIAENWERYGEIRRAQMMLMGSNRNRRWTSSDKFESAGDFLDRLPAFSIPDLIPGLVPLSGITMLHGHPRDMKSLIMLELCLSIATGSCAFGIPRLRAPEEVPVAYVTEEDSEIQVATRLRLLLNGRGMKEPPPTFRLLVGRGITLDSDESEWTSVLQRACQEQRTAFLVFDPIRSVSDGVDQGPAEIRPLVRRFRELQRAFPVGLGFVHHDVKAPLGRQDRTSDRRRLPQRASGGGIFSIADAPIHVDRIDVERVRLTPAAYKFSADPDRVVIRLESDHPRHPTFLRLVGSNQNDAPNADDVKRMILEALSGGAMASSNAVVRAVGLRKPTVLAALEDLREQGRVERRVCGRAHEWLLTPNPSGSKADIGAPVD